MYPELRRYMGSCKLFKFYIVLVQAQPVTPVNSPTMSVPERKAAYAAVTAMQFRLIDVTHS
jgi:hypothetical protein